MKAVRRDEINDAHLHATTSRQPTSIVVPIRPTSECNNNARVSPRAVAVEQQHQVVASPSTPTTSKPADKPNGATVEEKQRVMMGALTQLGYDKESAYYALKLVHFRSVTDAVKILTSIKSNDDKGLVAVIAANNNQRDTAIASRHLAAPTKSLPADHNHRNMIVIEDAGAATASPSTSARTSTRLQIKKSAPPTHESTTNPQFVRSTPIGGVENEEAKRNLESTSTANVPTIRSKLSRTTLNVDERQQQHRAPTVASSEKTRVDTRPDQRITQTARLDITIAAPTSNASTPTVTVTQPDVSSKPSKKNISSPQLTQQSKSPTLRTLSTSPLPSVNLLNEGDLDSTDAVIKPCKAAMFQFFMEQHTEKQIQQYHERTHRAFQLTSEMEAAGLAESMKEKMLKLLRQKESRYMRLKRQRMNISMFDQIRHIGVGAFGTVTLVTKKDNGEVYAMKTLSKADVIQKQQAAHVKAERDILAEANSDWIVKLYFSFQDTHNLYFILEYVPGGDLMQLLINKGVFEEKLARQYTAELVCAIEYVHSLGFIHRDIKPDNILIDKEGHVKLTDFGLCTGLRWTHDKKHYVSYYEPHRASFHQREDSYKLLQAAPENVHNLKLLQYRQHKKRNLAHSMVGTANYMAHEERELSGI